mgnify:CR=1 FL=1|tara:strand:+ start:135013 stop:135183 length:171 start_codon:yes stop_codon:yes gene_type:complete
MLDNNPMTVVLRNGCGKGLLYLHKAFGQSVCNVLARKAVSKGDRQKTLRFAVVLLL